MTEADVRAELRRKKTRTAKGLDGVSLADLKHMPSGVIQSYCRFFEHAELCGCWPRQLAVGRVASIAKTPTPTGAADYRPITGLSLGYRVWSSFHSRNLIAALDPWLPAGLFGSRLACHSGHVWSSILLAIEEANECAIPLAGVVCDIEKAFNCLSRTVVFAIATLLQMPMNVLTGWAGMLTQVSRHFEVRQSLSPATYSCTGFPEGDGLSVVAMILLDCALHWWMEEGTRLCRTLTYVDDWQMLLQDPNQVTHAMQNLEHFCRMVDLNLDRKKTYVWCLTGEGRQMLRSQGYDVGHGGRNLGAHLQLTRQHTNSTLQERARSLTELWDRLRLSSSPYKLKVRALTVAAWPKGLHGVASTALGSHWIARLRSGAMRGLQADGAGCSPWIHLGLIENPLCDTGFWCIMQTIRCIRDSATADFLKPVLTRLVTEPSGVPANSFTHTLLARVQKIGWSLRDDGRFQDSLGPFCLFQSNFLDIEARAAMGWQGVVAQQVSHRQGLQDLQLADVRSTRLWLAAQGAEDAGHCRKLLNGAHFTADAKQYWCDEPTGICPFCSCSDSRYHRFWQCEMFSAYRSHVHPLVWSMIPQLPEFLTCFGWSIMPATWKPFMQSLLDICEPAPDLSCALPAHQNWVDLFTDGSCQYPHMPWRLASWAVVQADPTQLEVEAMRSVVLAASPLQGMIQTAFRAELRAAVEALRIGRALGCKVRLWCDCQGIVSKLHKLQNGKLRIKPNCRHSDLWIELAELVTELGAGSLIVTKVASHQDGLRATTAVHGWCFVNNGLVDHAAKVAHLLRPHAFLELHEQYIADTRFAMFVSREVQEVLLAISRAVIQHQTAADEEAHGQMVDAVPKLAADGGDFGPLDPQPWVSAGMCTKFGERIVCQIAKWFQNARESFSNSHAHWISFYQLYVDYMLCSGEGGPIKQDRWTDPGSRPNADLLDISFKLRCRWFTHLVKELWKLWTYNIRVAFTRPHSETLILHASCAWLPWPMDRLDSIEAWMSARLQGQAKRDGRQLLRLPTAVKDCNMPGISGTMEVR